MQDINCFCEFGNVHHAIDATFVANSDFPDTRANVFHWLPVLGFHPQLHPKELLASFPAGVLWKAAKICP
jgi:hypothetical protein